ncbi:MAG: D-alanyl-D-alanine carboxypeptidase [Solirubrobacterales bacterium]|nr:D-alanyl-D-alanine carboxypeptidase [Solirubrobacterales bacterium]
MKVGDLGSRSASWDPLAAFVDSCSAARPCRPYPAGAASLVLLLVSLLGGGPAEASTPAPNASWTGVSHPTVLYEAPAEQSRVLAVVPAQDQEGLPVAVRVDQLVDREGVAWIKTRFGSTRGWIPAAGLPPANATPLSPVLLSALSASLKRAGAGASAVFADSNGQTLFARQASRTRILASNVKMFVTAAALDRLGSVVGPLLGRILRPSDNWLAQKLLDRLAPSRAERIRIAEGFAHRIGARVHLVDGSGLGRASRAAPTDVVAFLVGMRLTPTFALWRDALPVTGRSGTLAGRMRGSAAEGSCQAKTGTLRDVSTLSGYCTTSSGRRVVLSILFNDIAPWRGRLLQDQMVTSLVRLG